MSREVYIVSATRTPIGSFMGSLSAVEATDLGAAAIKGAIEKAGIDASAVQEVFFGNVLSANLGQAPARQAALKAGISINTPCTTVNKVCASGTKSTMLGAMSVALGDNDIVVVGGMESMSNVPYYVPQARSGYKFGHAQLADGMIKDGLWDVYNDYHMGNAAEKCAVDCNISREDQDAYAIESYKKVAASHEAGLFKAEITPVTIKGRKGDIVVSEDEEFKNVMFDKIPSLRPAFQKDGTVTAANASTLNDGAAALVLMSKEKCDELGLTPIAKIVSYADAAQEPENFTTAPTPAVQKAVQKAGLTMDQIDFFELNEAFSVVAIANQQKLNIPAEKINAFGGAVAIGHPLGCSGARIIVTLLNVMKNKGGKYGAVGICNGGGGASALVVEYL
ncbi:MAG: acetyl-CoA C-acyltransferase [Bacteroidetes bacterium]|nr:acetyl-CoA C-acyltransferase [Bacteroidota bacterium]